MVAKCIRTCIYQSTRLAPQCRAFHLVYIIVTVTMKRCSLCFTNVLYNQVLIITRAHDCADLPAVVA